MATPSVRISGYPISLRADKIVRRLDDFPELKQALRDDQVVRLVAGWQKAGGEIELQLYKGAGHGFMTGKPNAPYAGPAIERMKAFIRKHTG